MIQPLEQVHELTDQEWLQKSASYWLGTHHILRWLWNLRTKRAIGFEVFSEHGLVVTVRLSERSES